MGAKWLLPSTRPKSQIIIITASCTSEKCKITRPPDGTIHPENLVRMPRTVSMPDSKNLDRQTDGTTENVKLSSQYKSPGYKELSNAKAYEFSFVFLRFWINTWLMPHTNVKVAQNYPNIRYLLLPTTVHCFYLRLGLSPSPVVGPADPPPSLGSGHRSARPAQTRSWAPSSVSGRRRRPCPRRPVSRPVRPRRRRRRRRHPPTTSWSPSPSSWPGSSSRRKSSTTWSRSSTATRAANNDVSERGRRPDQTLCRCV